MFSFKKWWQPKPIDMKKFLLVGLGNVGATYANTRHNIGFDIIDALAKEWELDFETGKSALIARKNFKGKTLVLIKPTTLMNRSGKACFSILPGGGIPLCLLSAKITAQMIPDAHDE